MLLGPQEGQDSVVGAAGGAQPALGVGQHQPDPVDAEQPHPRVHKRLHRPVQVGGHVKVLEGLQVVAAGVVLGLGLPGREGQDGRRLRLQPAQQPAQGRQPAVVVEHRLHRGGDGEHLAAAPPEPQRPVGHPAWSPWPSRLTIERNP
jgi:hypothetical protein